MSIINKIKIPYSKSKNLSIKIEKNDCIKFLSELETGSVDVITTDPAYSGMNNKLKLGKGRIVGKYLEKGTSNGKWFIEFQDTVENYSKFLSECKRVLNPKTGHIYLMFDSFSLLSLGGVVRDFFDVKNIIVWDKINMGMGHYFRRRHELILFATSKNTRKINNRKFPDIWRFKRIHNASYPTQKPTEIFETMLFASSKSGHVVCDPFFGSGSSAIAAIKNSCNFIGCDISDKAFDITNKRVREYIKTNKDIYQEKQSSLENEPIFWK